MVFEFLVRAFTATAYFLASFRLRANCASNYVLVHGCLLRPFRRLLVFGSRRAVSLARSRSGSTAGGKRSSFAPSGSLVPMSASMVSKSGLELEFTGER